MFAPRLAEALGQPVVVENRPGSNGNLAMEAAAHAAPDGHTLLLCADAQIVIGPHLYAKMPLDTLKDLDPVTTLANTQMVLSVSPALPVKSLKEFFEYARREGYQLVRGTYLPTAKNGMVKDFLANFGFARSGSLADGGSTWDLAVADYRPREVFVHEIDSGLHARGAEAL